MRLNEGMKNWKFLIPFGMFLILSTFFTYSLVMPPVSVNADTNTASANVGPYTMSISTDDSVSIEITPGSSNSVYTGTNEISYTNTCPHGSNISVSTSTSDTGLIRSGTDDYLKTIPATTGNNLLDNSWGYSVDNGSTYHAVPSIDSPVSILNTSQATISAATLNVIYGVRINNQIPSGNYTNDVIYTVSANQQCSSYDVSWDLGGGTTASSVTYPSSLNFGSTIDLTGLTPTKAGYKFNGWSNGADTFASSESAANINPDDADVVTMVAQWSVENYTVSYALNGGSATNPTSYSVETASFTLNNPTRTGYTFAGWSGTGLSGSNNTSVTVAKGSTGNRS